MDKGEIHSEVVQERLRLCDQVQTLTSEQWNAASLCAGWRTRDVFAHLVSLQDIPTWKFLVGIVGMKGFNRRVDRFARQYGERDPAELVARHGQLAPSRLAPPFIGPIAPLTDVVVHGLDIQRPLGLEPTYNNLTPGTTVTPWRSKTRSTCSSPPTDATARPSPPRCGPCRSTTGRSDSGPARARARPNVWPTRPR
jgi:uncharacterized protein (TIGR03083 family)